MSEGLHNRKKFDAGNSSDDSDSDAEFGIPRWQKNKTKTSEIGEFKYLGGKSIACSLMSDR